MKPQGEPYQDPLIDEVRARRADLYRSLDCDIRKLVEAIQELQRKHPEKLRRPAKVADRSVMGDGS